MAVVSLEELHLFHDTDREVFSKLVITLMRDPAESLLVVATWLWLEDVGYPNIIVKMADLLNSVVNALADEAVLALKCLESNTFPRLTGGGLSLTSRLMDKNISLGMFVQNKFTAISGIKNFLNTVCSRIFTDILQHVIAGKSAVMSIGQPLLVPGFPHPVFGNVIILPRAVDNEFPTGGLWGWEANNNITEDERTMFLTFSRGFPVTKEEVTDLFTENFGDIVVSVQMQDNVSSDEQPLFAKMVLRNIKAVDRVLNGQRIAKFRVNGKHIWARKYERRD
ncbi:hypothetical protein K2173_025791 [Erythroxylum novogranatense]|uniref:RRM domain-containing protein n=1 Tax=Erythroxylum novogranatense TaxID=1862640 RepID=A0AAV8SI58_9ROSI|nr:hypothetical protein K2173_025791 [Erythroxylum novogranatense]